MLPIHKIIWHEWRARDQKPVRVPEPEAMTDPEQIKAYMKAYEWGGPTSGLQLHHLYNLARLIRPGDHVLDLACGPGPLLLELARRYPDVHFTGVDLSEPMLDALLEQAVGLHNVTTAREDIRVLPSIPDGSVDVVISTSALHHLPDLATLEAAFRAMHRVMKPDARIYLFDFGLLKSPKTRALMVHDVAKLAPPLTAEDYRLSLDAAFPIDGVFEAFRRGVPREVGFLRSRFVDFYYFITSPSSGLRSTLRTREMDLNRIEYSLPLRARAEMKMLDWLTRISNIPGR